jgi:hypothetical protein
MAMHKWMWSLTAAALFGLVGCKQESGRLGQEDRVAEQSPEVTGGEDLADQEIYGTVTGVAGNSITVKDDGGTTMTLALGEDTRFVSRGQQADRAQLQEGSQVRASYDELSGKYEATTVELLPKASSPQGK